MTPKIMQEVIYTPGGTNHSKNDQHTHSQSGQYWEVYSSRTTSW